MGKMRVWTGVIVCAMLTLFSVNPAKAGDYTDICNTNEWEVLKIVNKERIKDKKEPLSTYALIQSAADVRTDEIGKVFSHTRPDGTTCFTVLKEKGVVCNAAGENIAAGQRTPQEVMEDWMNSPGHRGNILSGDYTHIGIGYGAVGSYGSSWVQLFSGTCSPTALKVNQSTDAYPVGTSIDEMNCYLTVTCTHGTGYVPIISSMCSGYQADKAGKQNVTVTFQGQSVSMPVVIGSTSDTEENTVQTAVKKPKKVTALSGRKVNAKSYRLTWKKLNCDGYEVWRTNSKNKKYKKIKTIHKGTTNQYADNLSKLKEKGKYYYKVRAYNLDGKKKKYGTFSAVKTYVKK